jgi:hypothetical protein
MRQEFTQSPKTAGFRRVKQVQRLTHREPGKLQFQTTPRPISGRVQTLSSKRVPFDVNRSGLFNWSRWDGRLWDTTALPFYHWSRLLYLHTRTNRLLRQAQIRAAQCAIPVDDDFWSKYYGRIRLANQSLLSLHLHLCETNAIIFILRTSPKFIYDRVIQTLQVLGGIHHELVQYCRQLHGIRRVIVHQTHNPLYFKASVGYTQDTAPIIQLNSEIWSDAKKLRMQHKMSFGHDWDLRSGYQDPNRSTLDKSERAQRIQAVCNAYTPRWTIEPLANMIALRIHHLRRCSHMLYQIPGFIRWRLTAPLAALIRKRVRDMMIASWELSELREEIAALRYYRLHHFPDSTLPGEIEVGRRVWSLSKTGTNPSSEASQDTASDGTGTGDFIEAIWSPPVSTTRAQPEELDITSPHLHNDLAETHTSIRRTMSTNKTSSGTNQAGLFSWSQWNGADWNLDSFKPYKIHNAVVYAIEAQANYEAVRQRLSSNSSSHLDAYLMAHYGAQRNANQLMHPFLRFSMNIRVINYLLRTSPFRVVRHLSGHVMAMDSLDFELGNEIETLRRLRTALACLPHNSLYFRSQAMGLRAGRERFEVANSIKMDVKYHRAARKAATGFQGLPRTYRQEEKEARALAKKMASITQIDAISWHLQHPFCIAEPFQAAVTLKQTRLLRVRRYLRQFKTFFIEVVSSRVWWEIEKALARASQYGQQIAALTSDLTAIRYYRAQHFPDSVSQEELRLGLTLRAQFDRTLKPGIRWEKFSAALKVTGNDFADTKRISRGDSSSMDSRRGKKGRARRKDC